MELEARGVLQVKVAARVVRVLMGGGLESRNNRPRGW
jgi:hypothetical protein